MTRQIPEWLLRSPLVMRAAGIPLERVAKPARKPLPVEGLRERITPADTLSYARRRRSKLRKAKRCINGWSHGKATHGCRCKRCYLVHGGKRRKIVRRR